MPRYFFSLFNDETSIDHEGKECVDLEAAVAHGMSETRDMVGVSARKGHIDLDHRIDITDEIGTVLKTIRFGDAVTIRG